MDDTVTTEQASYFLSQRWEYDITKRGVLGLIETGALKSVGKGYQERISMPELDAFAERTHRMDPEDWPLDLPLYRVSVIALREDVVLDADGSVLRTHAGVDYAERTPLSPKMRELAWTGCWRVSEENIEHAIESKAILYATTRGYISPDYVRQIVGYRRNPSGPGIWWETAAVPGEIGGFLGEGIWMPVPRGPECGWTRR